MRKKDRDLHGFSYHGFHMHHQQSREQRMENEGEEKRRGGRRRCSELTSLMREGRVRSGRFEGVAM